MFIFSETDFCIVNEQNARHYHPINCEKYIFCNTHFITEQFCQSNFVYDLSSERCLSRDNVPCAQEVIESITVSP